MTYKRAFNLGKQYPTDTIKKFRSKLILKLLFHLFDFGKKRFFILALKLSYINEIKFAL